MAVPKKQRSKSKVRARRGAQVIKIAQKATCSQCGSVKIAHTACGVCGTYKGKEVIDVGKRLRRKERKLKTQKEEE